MKKWKTPQIITITENELKNVVIALVQYKYQVKGKNPCSTELYKLTNKFKIKII